MNLSTWIGDTISRCKDSIPRGIMYGFHHLYESGYMGFSSRIGYGMNVFSQDWDLLLVLDACRADALQEVASDYDFLNGIRSIRSTGTVTTEWMSKTFSQEYINEINNTIYICSNPQGKVVFDDRNFPPGDAAPFDITNWDVAYPSDFYKFDRAWEYGFDEDLNTIPPRPITDRAISLGRSEDVDRMILHYSQPHTPFIGEDATIDTYGSYQEQEDLSKEVVRESYISNLRYVLDDVELLLQNIDANKVVITADHGDVHGELSIFGHPGGLFHPSILNVPWAETSASDEETHDPDTSAFDELSESNTREMLEDLGYIL